MTVKITRTRLAALVVLAALALTGLVLACADGGILSAHYRVDTLEGRETYLRALGWEIDPASEDIRETSLPAALDATLADYNAVQREQGFDLTPYLGKPIRVVTYRVTNYPAQQDVLVCLWICDGIVIAGDIHTTAAGGFLHGIIKE